MPAFDFLTEPFRGPGPIWRMLVLKRKNGGFDARAQVEFAHDVTHMQFDGVVADIERLGDDLVALTAGDMVKHLAFAFGE